jgi:hypothetical protein
MIYKTCKYHESIMWRLHSRILINNLVTKNYYSEVIAYAVTKNPFLSTPLIKYHLKYIEYLIC